MRRYTFDELIAMDEKTIDALVEDGKMDDDDWQRWHDINDEVDALSAAFLEEMKYWL